MHLLNYSVNLLTTTNVMEPPSFYQWAKEQNHEIINKFFHELLEIIKSNVETFHDISIIEHLNATVLLSAKTNPYLLDCWITFITKYNAETNSFTPIGKSMHIKIGPEGTPSERIIRELKETLEITQRSFNLAQKAYSTEVESLKRQLEETKQANVLLTSQNQILKGQVRSEEAFVSLNPQIVSAQEQLMSLTQLLTTLSGITSSKLNISTTLPFSQTTASPKKTEPLESSHHSDHVSVGIAHTTNPDLKDKPAPTLLQDSGLSSPQNITIPKENPSKITPLSPPKSNPTPLTTNAKNSGFFSGDKFLSELNAKIKERKEKPKNESHVSSVEKKTFSQLLHSTRIPGTLGKNGGNQKVSYWKIRIYS